MRLPFTGKSEVSLHQAVVGISRAVRGVLDEAELPLGFVLFLFDPRRDPIPCAVEIHVRQDRDDLRDEVLVDLIEEGLRNLRAHIREEQTKRKGETS